MFHLPIIPPVITPVVIPPPKSSKSTTAAINAKARTVLVVASMIRDPFRAKIRNSIPLLTSQHGSYIFDAVPLVPITTCLLKGCHEQSRESLCIGKLFCCLYAVAQFGLLIRHVFKPAPTTDLYIRERGRQIGHDASHQMWEREGVYWLHTECFTGRTERPELAHCALL